MDRILKIGFCVILIGVYWIHVAESSCQKVGYFEKCEVCTNKSCPVCADTIPNAECRHDNMCRCKEGYGRTNAMCVKATKIVKHGNFCDRKNILCNGDDFLDCGFNGECVCLLGTRWNDDVEQCIYTQGGIFDACSAQQEDTCNKTLPLKCDKKTNRCLLQKGYKYDCETDGFEKGTQDHGQKCDEEPCSTVNSCSLCNPDLNLECQNEECVCESEYYWDPTEGRCLKYKEYNESCKSIKCNPDSNLECNDDSVCDCKEGLFEYDEDEKRCVICVIEEEGATLEGVLIAILVAVYLGVVGEVGLIVWLVRRHRRVHPGDLEEGSSNQNESKKRKDKKSKNLPEQIKKTGKSKKDPKIKIKP